MAVVSIIGLIIAVAGAAFSYVQQRKAQKKADKARKEGNAISSASEKNKQAAARRKAIRERRVVLSRIQQASENTGVGQSSGEIGSGAVLGVNIGSNVANSSAGTKTAEGLSKQNSIIASANSDAQQAVAFGNLMQSVGSAVASTGFSFGGAAGGMSGGTTAVAPSGQTRGFNYGMFGGGV